MSLERLTFLVGAWISGRLEMTIDPPSGSLMLGTVREVGGDTPEGSGYFEYLRFECAGSAVQVLTYPRGKFDAEYVMDIATADGAVFTEPGGRRLIWRIGADGALTAAVETPGPNGVRVDEWRFVRAAL